MAEALTQERVALQRLAVKSLGLEPHHPMHHQGQMSANGLQGDIIALPIDAANVHPLQDLNPASPTFGAFYFAVGLSVVNGPDLVR